MESPCFLTQPSSIRIAALALLCWAAGSLPLAGAEPALNKPPEAKAGPTQDKEAKAEPAKDLPPEAKAAPTVPRTRKNDLKPLPAEEAAKTVHGPYSDGDCSVCHKNADSKDPGPLKASANELCLDCHEDYKPILARKYPHGAAQESCVNCHNPHNSKQGKLLVEEVGSLCLSCHDSIQTLMKTAKVQHGALTEGGKCVSCHDPHGADVEHLLPRLAYDSCIKCHGQDDVVDHQGKKLVNFTTLLAENKVAHGPVDSKDCSACHNPHASPNFRLLTMNYPPQFYSPYDPQLYALCFDCHEQSILTDAETTTLTNFRNGKTNLHYLHVNKTDRGRTCRACHEVHASKQPHQIRDAVPYGSKGWMLKINFTPTPTGGSCTKTCHDTRSYTNRVALAAPTPEPK